MFAAFVVQLIVSLVIAAISYALTPKPKAAAGQKAQDVTSPTLDAGAPLQVVFGRMRIKNPNTLAYGGDRTTEIKK